MVSAVCSLCGGGSNIAIGLYSLDIWTCVFYMWVVKSNIVIGVLTGHGQCCVLSMWVVGSNIAIGILDMWSVLCDM